MSLNERRFFCCRVYFLFSVVCGVDDSNFSQMAVWWFCDLHEKHLPFFWHDLMGCPGYKNKVSELELLSFMTKVNPDNGNETKSYISPWDIFKSDIFFLSKHIKVSK